MNDYFENFLLSMPMPAKPGARRSSVAGTGTAFALPLISTRKPLGPQPLLVTTKSSWLVPETKKGLLLIEKLFHAVYVPMVADLIPIQIDVSPIVPGHLSGYGSRCGIQACQREVG